MVLVSRTPNISRSKLNNTQKIFLEKHGAVILVNGQTPFGEDFYVYLHVNKAAFAKINLDYKQGNIINCFEYGDVLEFGSGTTPPEEVSQRIEAEYMVT